MEIIKSNVKAFETVLRELIFSGLSTEERNLSFSYVISMGLSQLDLYTVKTSISV